MLIRSGLGLSFGVIFSVLLFKRRAWPAWVGLGFGAGRAWEEADGMFRLAYAVVFNGSRKKFNVN
jgi:MICOS complex subunit MIC10